MSDTGGDSTPSPTPTPTTTLTTTITTASPPRVLVACRVGQRRFDSYPDPDSHHTSNHHHHRECLSLVVSDTGGDSTRTPTPTPTTPLTTTTTAMLVARRVRQRRLDSDADPDSHPDPTLTTTTANADPDSHPDPTLTTTTASARRSSLLVARRVRQRRLDSDADPDSHPDPTLTTTTASARRSSCQTAATRLRRRPRLTPRPDSNHHHRECSSLVVSDSGDSTQTPTPTRTTTPDSHHREMRVYTQADVDHALNTPPSPSDRPGKVYGLRVKHPDGSVVLKCWKDDIVLLWEVPTNHASKLEHLCHRLFKANDTWMTPEGCESCGVFHREKFLADELGGSDEARKLVEQMAKKMRD
ncbi:hypothetical protein K438DRAFT_1982649 [Mycena galopus ATCC 62051]|nr:hypothetical protein K438DRAFT_1982649 [Mycena galopus ATCC 62051]